MPTAIEVASNIHWSNIVTASAAAVQALAIVVAGAFGYVRFIRRRVHHASLTPDIKLSLIEVDGRKSLQIETAVKNTGTYRMIFDETCEQRLELTFLQRDRWRNDCHNAQLPWAVGPVPLRWDQLVDEYGYRRIDDFIEPGDSSERIWVVPVPQGDWVAYQASFTVSARAKKVIATDQAFRCSVAEVVVEA